MKHAHPFRSAPPSILRLIDANANRAREGLRVLEDLARFVLNHAVLAERFKTLRHDLASALALLPGDQTSRLASRDTPGDVGVSIKTSDEGSRLSLRDVALAAAKRVSEALRALEEAAKLTPSPDAQPAPWSLIEQLRYRLYEDEKRLVLMFGSGPATQWKLCLLISPDACLLDWPEVVTQALDNGVDCVQLRIKQRNDQFVLETAKKLRRMLGARAHYTPFLVNDRPDLALLCSADGVHLGREDLPIEDARRIIGSSLLVGASTHDLHEAHDALKSGADYCGVGTMFPSSTKSRPTSSVDYLKAYLADPALAPLPHLAIGGITPDNINTLIDAGCKGIAVSAVVCQSPTPGSVCAALRAAIDRNW